MCETQEGGLTNQIIHFKAPEERHMIAQAARPGNDNAHTIIEA